MVKNLPSQISHLQSILLLAIICSLTNCTNIDRVDTAQVKDLVESSEIKRVTSVELTATTNRIGKLLSDSLNVVFENQASINCDVSTNAFVKKLAADYGIKVRLLGVSDTTSTLLHSKEREVIQAYVYNFENNLPIEPNIQKMGDSLLIYSATAGSKFTKTCPQFTDNKLAVWSLVFPVGEVIKRME